MNYLPVLAVSAGAAIAIQATMNAQLGTLLKSPILGASVAFLVSAVFSVFAFFIFASRLPVLTELKSVPWYLWFMGGALSALGVGLFYYLIPKMGVGSMMSYALSGQLLVAIVSSHFGLFGSPEKPIDPTIVVGALSLILGVALLNGGGRYEYG